MLYAYLNSPEDTPAAPRSDRHAPDSVIFDQTDRDGCFVLRVQGVLDAHTSPRLETHLTAAAQTDCRGLIVNLRDASFADSSGVGALVSALHAAEKHGVWIRLVGTPTETLQVLRSTALDTVLATFSSVTKAIRFKPTSAASPLQQELSIEDGYCRLTLDGGFELSTVQPVEQLLADAIEQGHRHIVVDLENVTLIDAHALGVLVGTLRRVKKKNGWLRVVCTDDQILKVLGITGLDHVLAIFGSVEEAASAKRLTYRPRTRWV
jgi:anti-sigma B factor antagonist